jgi:hypothetical protein
MSMERVDAEFKEHESAVSQELVDSGVVALALCWYPIGRRIETAREQLRDPDFRASLRARLNFSVDISSLENPDFIFRTKSHLLIDQPANPEFHVEVLVTRDPKGKHSLYIPTDGQPFELPYIWMGAEYGSPEPGAKRFADIYDRERDDFLSNLVII